MGLLTYIAGCIGVISFLLLFFAGYAYFVNSLRQPDDPTRQDFEPAALVLAPLTWPFFLLYLIVSTIIKAILFGFFLVAFIFAAIFSWMLIHLTWIHKGIMKIGTEILKANTSLIRLFKQEP